MSHVQALDLPVSNELSAESAIPRLLQQHGDTLYQLGLRICGTPQEAEDLVQDTFLLAYQHWDQFRGDAKPKTWLYTIASRVCQRTKRLRSGEPRHIQSLDELIPRQGDPVADVWIEPSPLDDAERVEGVERMSEAISTLPLDFRMPLVLKDIAELSVREVATILELKEPTVKTRVHRARLHLRRRLAAQLPAKPNAQVADRQICLDLVRAKLDSMDKGGPFTVPDQVICHRCESLFRTLDLTQETCREIGRGSMPDELYDRLRKALAPAPC